MRNAGSKGGCSKRRVPAPSPQHPLQPRRDPRAPGTSRGANSVKKPATWELEREGLCDCAERERGEAPRCLSDSGGRKESLGIGSAARNDAPAVQSRPESRPEPDRRHRTELPPARVVPRPGPPRAARLRAPLTHPAPRRAAAAGRTRRAAGPGGRAGQPRRERIHRARGSPWPSLPGANLAAGSAPALHGPGHNLRGATRPRDWALASAAAGTEAHWGGPGAAPAPPRPAPRPAQRRKRRSRAGCRRRGTWRPLLARLGLPPPVPLHLNVEHLGTQPWNLLQVASWPDLSRTFPGEFQSAVRWVSPRERQRICWRPQ